MEARIMKAELAKACWQALSDTTPNHITMAQLADDCGISYDEAILHGGDVTHLILHQLDAFDDEALTQSYADFAEDPDASSYDKIFEGLIMRFEVMDPSRKQFENLHDGAKRQPLLAIHCLHQLSHSTDKLLSLSGDNSTGAIRQARIAGVVGVLMRVRSVWISDDTNDLGLTMKALDKELKKACEWALSLRILSQDDLAND